MTDVPLSGNEDWRKVLKELPLPLSVQKDQLLIECLDSITNGGYVDVEKGVELYVLGRVDCD